MSTETIVALLPEIVLSSVAVLILVAGAFTSARGLWSWVAAGAIFVAAYALVRQYMGLFAPVGEPATVPLAVEIDGPLAIDLLALLVRGLVLGLGLLFVLIAARRSSQEQGPEFLGTLLLAVTGLMIVASARDLVLLFLGLELISIPTYILLYLGRRDAASQESAAKYFYLSILSSALLLYGFSFIYGAAGSTSLVDIRGALAKTAGDSDWTQVVAALGLVLVFAGLGFKIAAVPFHFYAPDVYQGTTNANAGLLAVLPKVAGVVGLVRIVAVDMPGSETYAWRLAVILALLTMTVGNVMALWQNNIRRLLAYSSIAHGGYLLIGLAVAFVAAAGADVAAGFDGLSATLLYLVVYVLATTGTFAALAFLGDDQAEVSTVDELAGLGRGHPWAALALAVFMFSLAGVPPLAGFWGKLELFTGALGVDAAAEDPSGVRLWFVALAVVGGLNAAIAAGYYLRVVAVMYFRSPLGRLRAAGGAGAGAAMLLAALLVVAIGVWPNGLVRATQQASQSAFAQPAETATAALPAGDATPR